MQKEIGGVIRKRVDGMSELTITGAAPVKLLLTELLPHIRMKKSLAELVLSIIEAKDQVRTRDDFIEVCRKVDKVAEYTDSKKRTITTSVVLESWGTPESASSEKT